VLARTIEEENDDEAPKAEESSLNLLLIHGALGASSQLESLRARLSAMHTVQMVELEGHGETPPGRSPWSIEAFAANVAAAMDRVRFDRAAIFGYSMGGYVALALAAERPERVAAVVTLGTKLAWSPEVAVRETSRLDPGVIRAKVPKFAAQLEERHRGAGGWEGVLARTAALMTELGNRPIVDSGTLGRIAQPVRFMVGDRDALVTIEETAAAAKQVPKGELAVLPNTPHPIEQAEVEMVAGMVGGFLARVST
jgi:pimeloyl-ACP methyl ester carboxylesterase